MPCELFQKHCLETHIRRKHTGEQFVCGLCHYVTFDRYGLNQHFKQHQFETVNDEAGIVTSVMPLQINVSWRCLQSVLLYMKLSFISTYDYHTICLG